MLEPQTRATLTDQLRPPTGFELSYAVGTTFTLDLASALAVPLAFAAHRARTGFTDSAADAGDALSVLDAIRRASDRIDVFAQAGEISMGTRSDLVAFLEPIIHPVVTPQGLFHPKVWFLQYRSGDELRHRFVCASRNLTADRSWDVLVRLDEDPDATADPDVNAPLIDLLHTLPGLCVQPMPTARIDRLNAFAERLRAVRWELPPGLWDLAFHVGGLGLAPLPDLRGERSLIISPFLSDDGLALLRGGIRDDTHVISRAESLDRLSPDTLDGRLSTYVLDDAAVLDDDTATADAASALASEPLVGLHAKAIVVDRTGGSRVLLGSANATGAAWHRNVEVMVGLTGRRAEVGVHATLDALGELKDPYPTAGGQVPDADEEAQHRLDAVLRRLAGAALTTRVTGAGPYDLRVWADDAFATAAEQAADAGITLSWHPLTRPDLRTATLAATEEAAASLTGLPLTDLTPFIVLAARDADGREQRTVALARLLDDIPTRVDAIIARQLTDKAAFVRLLTLMLELAGLGSLLSGSDGALGFFPTAGAAASGSGLFEALLRAVAAGGRGLEDAHRIVEFVRAHGDDAEVIPDGFDELWEQVWDAHRSLQRSRRMEPAP